ncbi:MAG: phosphatase PAP2 family protein [Clostridia bacterium]|nr:phosphatase PAP2 family protein [Clostridia bacterium]
MNLNFLYLLEGIRTPFLDKLFLAVTGMGDELFFIALALAVFWCINKKTGYYLITVCFFGIVVNQSLKLLFRVPRPWVRDPSFSMVEAARESASGYSFPSGHTQNAVSIFGCLFASSNELIKKRSGANVFRAVCVLLAVLVAFSRMYLGVHTPADVLTSAAIAVIMLAAFYPFFKDLMSHPDRFYYIIGVMAMFAAGYLALSYGAGAGNEENVLSAQKHAWYMFGGILGVAVSYPLERKFVNFDTRAGVPGQILKLVIGCALVIGIKAVLKQPLLALFGGHMAAHAVRYFLIVFFAVFVWPNTFKFFALIKR